MKITKLLIFITLLALIFCSCEEQTPPPEASAATEKEDNREKITISQLLDGITENEELFAEKISIESFLEKGEPSKKIQTEEFFDAFEDSFVPEEEKKIESIYSESIDSIGTLYKKAVKGDE